MKRICVLRLLFAVSMILMVFTSSANGIKRKHGTIKFENGNTYVGEYAKIEVKISANTTKKMKLPHGKGQMTCTNGDRKNGYWSKGEFIKGTWQYANGNTFIGTCENYLHENGTMTYVSEGSIVINETRWIYPADSKFKGSFISGWPNTGNFDKPIVSADGREFSGHIQNGRLQWGVMVFPNGDSFTGGFTWSGECKDGKYKYAEETVVKIDTCAWSIPAGCTFSGKMQTFTGRFDKTIRDVNTNNQYVGNLENGQPVGKGTMIYANGDEYTGNFKMWQPDGEGTMAYANGDKYTGKFKTGRPNGTGTMVYANGDKYTGGFKNGQFDGSGTMSYADGRTGNTCLINGMPIDKFLRYHEKEVKAYEESLMQKLLRSKKSYVLDINYASISDMGGVVKVLQMLQEGSLYYLNGEKFCDEVKVDSINDRGVYISYHVIENGEHIDFGVYGVGLRRYKPEIKALYPPEETMPSDLYAYVYCIGLGYNGRYTRYTSYGNYNNYEKDIAIKTKLAEKWARDYWIRKYGQYYGTAVANRQIKLGMSMEMVKTVKGRGGIMSRRVSDGVEVRILEYYYFGGGGVMYTFVNDKLTKYLEY